MRKIMEFWRKITTPFRALGKAVAKPFKKIGDFFLEEPDDAPMVDSLQLAFEEPSSFLEHVGALRKHLLRSFVALLLCAVAAFVFLPQMLDFISLPIGGMDELNAVEVTEPISVAMRVVLLAAFAVSLPYTVFELLLPCSLSMLRQDPSCKPCMLQKHFMAMLIPKL